MRDDVEFLEAIQRTLLQLGIESVIKKKESKSYAKPVLKVTGIDNIHRLVLKVLNPPPTLPTLSRWHNFLLVVELIRAKKHYTEKGFNQIIILKELI